MELGRFYVVTWIDAVSTCGWQDSQFLVGLNESAIHTVGMLTKVTDTHIAIAQSWSPCMEAIGAEWWIPHGMIVNTTDLEDISDIIE